MWVIVSFEKFFDGILWFLLYILLSFQFVRWKICTNHFLVINFNVTVETCEFSLEVYTKTNIDLNWMPGLWNEYAYVSRSWSSKTFIQSVNQKWLIYYINMPRYQNAHQSMCKASGNKIMSDHTYEIMLYHCIDMFDCFKNWKSNNCPNFAFFYCCDTTYLRI